MDGAMTGLDARLGYTRMSVSVRGGDLAVGTWGPSNGPAVLAVHGVTANHLTWPALARRLPGIRIIAPDLRGRGRSNTLPGPWGMPQHADDLAAVLEHLGIERAVVVGHSMGAFASLVLANRHPQLVSSLVLVDGGLPLPAPAGMSDEELMMATLGPAAERLSMTFASRERYREFWKLHPAFARDWSELVEDYVDYDLVGDEPNLHPSSSYDAVAEDSIELRGGTSLLRAIDELAHPTTFLSAPRGLMDEIPPLYPVEAVAEWSRKLPDVRMLAVEDVNHYTIVMSDRGAQAISGVVMEAIRRETVSHNEVEQA
ncbi:alpha/beta fold hydrolase [Leifsonia bigeumensis]|uniref:Alpha/beta fold hydrolase n=1 Tax=Leifsonella bigeumensis TaxID=433643 RepID=A0ABP7FSR1_9MICO